MDAGFGAIFVGAEHVGDDIELGEGFCFIAEAHVGESFVVEGFVVVKGSIWEMILSKWEMAFWDS